MQFFMGTYSVNPEAETMTGEQRLQLETIDLLAGRAAEIRASQGSGPGWVRMLNEDEKLAHHEAAHGAAAHILLCHTVHRLSIEPDLTIKVGRTGYLAGCCVASPDAQEKQKPKPLALETDRRAALKKCWILGEQPPTCWNARRCYRLLETHAAKFCNENWLLIQALAHQLLQYRMLDQTQIKNVFSSFGLGAKLWVPPIACAQSHLIQ